MAIDFMSAFTGGPMQTAAADQRALYERTLNQGYDTLGSGMNLATGVLGAATGSGQGAQAAGYGTARTALDQGYAGAIDASNRGYANQIAKLGDVRGDLSGAQSYWGPLGNLGQNLGTAANLAVDISGAGGAAGNARAMQNFQASPGYQYTLGQGLEALDRRNAAAHMLGSGNADRDAVAFATNEANKDWTRYANYAQGLVNPAIAATQGAAAGQTSIAQMLANLGVTESGAWAAQGTGEAGMLGQQARDLANAATGFGTGYSNTGMTGATNIAKTISDADLARVNQATTLAPLQAKTFADAATAQQAGAANAWGLGLQLAKMATGSGGSLFGGVGGGGGGGNTGAYGSYSFAV